MFGMIHTYGNIIQIRLLEGACLNLNLILYLPFVIHLHVVDILVLRKQPLKYCNVVFIGLACSKMHILIVPHVIDVKEPVTLALGIKCL